MIQKNFLRVGTVVMAGALALSACSPDDGASSDSAPEATVDVAMGFDGQHVGSDQFAAAVAEPGVTIVDVRTPAEFAEGHLPGAVNIDVQSPTFASDIAALDAEGDYAVYCRSGNRSRVAIDEMQAAGLDHTIGLEGGIGAWTGDVVTD